MIVDPHDTAPGPGDHETGDQAEGRHGTRDHEELVARFEADGSQESLEQLLVRHLTHLRAYIELKAGEALRSRERVSDLIQSVCADILSDEEKFEFRGQTEFRHWLCKRALHKIVGKQRYHTAEKRDRRRELSIDRPSYAELCGTVITPSHIAGAKERWHAVERAFEDLPDDYRDAVLMRRILGLEYAQIAAEMNRGEGAARMLVSRGLARLSTLINAKLGTDT